MRPLLQALAIWIALVTASAAQPTVQSPPPVVPYNGVALDGAGHPLGGTVTVTFTIYNDQGGQATAATPGLRPTLDNPDPSLGAGVVDPTGGTPVVLWQELQTVQLDANGRYLALLGSTLPQGLPIELFTSGQARWLGVQVLGMPAQPRVLLASVPYALKAADANTIGGMPVSAFVLTDDAGVTDGSTPLPPPGQAPPGGQVPPDSDVHAQSGLARPPGVDAPQDQVILDDLIVDGSICVGFDCVNGEAFGFDTLRLKENNLRIKFQDTSNSASFPSNDWQITANDSSNGGANKFSIDDIDGGKTPFTLEANAPSHSLYVDNGGRLGLGTNNPVVDAHIVSGNTPTLRLEQNGSAGFTPQTWDVAGNETNFFIRDASNGSKLPFRIRPGAPGNSIFVDTDGEVGLGTASPKSRLHVHSSSTNSRSRLTLTTGDTSAAVVRGLVLEIDPSEDAYLWNYELGKMIIGTNGAARNTVASDGKVGIGTLPAVHPLAVGSDGTNGNGAHLTAGGVWTDTSSRATKENIEDLDRRSAFAALAGLQPVTFNYKLERGDPHAGFIAEDVPDLVATPDRKGLSSMDIVAVLTKVVQEQQDTIEKLGRQVAELEARMRLRAIARD